VISKLPGDRVVPALLEGLGFAVLAFFGSEALFGPGADGVPLAATLVPAVAAGATAFAYRVRNPLADQASAAEEAPSLPGIHRLSPQPAARAPEPRRDAA
jgi:hypothetical protein